MRVCVCVWLWRPPTNGSHIGIAGTCSFALPPARPPCICNLPRIELTKGSCDWCQLGNYSTLLFRLDPLHLPLGNANEMSLVLLLLLFLLVFHFAMIVAYGWDASIVVSLRWVRESSGRSLGTLSPTSTSTTACTDKAEDVIGRDPAWLSWEALDHRPWIRQWRCNQMKLVGIYTHTYVLKEVREVTRCAAFRYHTHINVPLQYSSLNIF